MPNCTTRKGAQCDPRAGWNGNYSSEKDGCVVSPQARQVLDEPHHFSGTTLVANNDAAPIRARASQRQIGSLDHKLEALPQPTPEQRAM